MFVNHWGENIIIRRPSGNRFLDIVQAGITYPNPSYRITHNITKQNTYEYYVFEYVVGGIGYIETPERVYTVKKGDLYFLNKLCHQIYYSDPVNPYEKIFIVIKGKFIDSLLQNYQMNQSIYIKNLNCHKFMLDFLNLLEKTDALDYDSISIKVLELFQLLFPSPHEIDRSQNHAAELVKNYIDTHIYDKITLEAISESLFISKSHIERAFKDSYSQTPLAYCADQKINQVASMLQTTDYSLSQIAQLLNYNDEKYMSKCFKKAKGISPIQYRKHKFALKEIEKK